jgi:hypothetical protein
MVDQTNGHIGRASCRGRLIPSRCEFCTCHEFARQILSGIRLPLMLTDVRLPANLRTLSYKAVTHAASTWNPNTVGAKCSSNTVVCTRLLCLAGHLPSTSLRRALRQHEGATGLRRVFDDSSSEQRSQMDGRPGPGYLGSAPAAST